MKRIFFIAGEASGDLHASNLANALHELEPELEFEGWGGDLMEKAGVKIHSHYSERAIMGFVEVLSNIFNIRKWFKTCREQIRRFDPDVVVLVDYGGFNLRIAKYLKEDGVRVHYYIPPKVWAWNEGRVKKIAQRTDKVSCILPFEEEYFRSQGVDARYVGNPLIRNIREFVPKPDFIEKHHIHKPYIALVPGSRKQELERILPSMLEVTTRFPEFDFVLTKAPGIADEFYDRFDLSKAIAVRDSTYDAISNAEAALVTSGTASLETALLDTPQVVLYKASPISYVIGRMVIKVKFISLVNLILNRKAVTELIQGQMTTPNIAIELKACISEKNRIRKDYKELSEIISDKDASRETARSVLDMN